MRRSRLSRLRCLRPAPSAQPRRGAALSQHVGKVCRSRRTVEPFNAADADSSMMEALSTQQVATCADHVRGLQPET